MGKRGKKQRDSERSRSNFRGYGGGGDGGEGDVLPSSAYDLPSPSTDLEDEGGSESVLEEIEKGDQDGEGGGEDWSTEAPSKFDLYQLSVQAPKGDISYMLKFFLMYVGGRLPLHLQEDFCGTALLSSDWIRSDSRRTAVGVDLDLEALKWCLDNNISKVGADGYSRIFLFHGNVLHPQQAKIVEHQIKNLMKDVSSQDLEEIDRPTSDIQIRLNNLNMDKVGIPSRDIVCAFNYSCCCLQNRKDLILYFKHAFSALSKRGGIFIMDLYGGTSSECKLRLRRSFSNFTYVWEQEEFDILNRRTRISIHFHLGKKKILRQAFSYDWRLWSLPEVKECLEEAGFHSIHFWIREMADTEDGGIMDSSSDRDGKYEECTHFSQRDAWNAYVIGVAKRC